MKPSSAIFAALMVAAGSSAWFVISTITVDMFPDAAIMTSALMVALAFVSAFAGTPVRPTLVDAARADVMLVVLGGALCWLAAPLLVLSQRSTDAPSGSETLFLTTAAWGLVCVLAAFVYRAPKPVWSQLAGALLGLLGSAAILANWERPSSFSPFIKFPEREMLFLFAGVLFAVGTLLVARLARKLGTRTALWVALAGALVMSLPFLLFQGFGDAATWARLWPQVLLLGVALGSFAVGWAGLSGTFGLARPAALLFAPSLAISALAALERSLSVYGPNPILWLGASAGGVLVISGAALVWGSAPFTSYATATPSDAPLAAPPAEVAPVVDPLVTRTRLGLATLVLAVLAVLLGVVTLAVPAFSARVEAVLAGGEAFRASWTMLGFESAAGWLALAGGLLALGGVLDLFAAGSPRVGVWTGVTGLLVLAAYPFLASTPLHTWNLWIPAEVQQSYGTEYALLSMNVMHEAMRYLALSLSVAACCTLVFYALRLTRRSPSIDAVKEETA